MNDYPTWRDMLSDFHKEVKGLLAPIREDPPTSLADADLAGSWNPSPEQNSDSLTPLTS